MAEITLGCLESVRNIATSLGGVPVMMINMAITPADLTLYIIRDTTLDLLDNCPHPPNVLSDTAPPRKFQRQVQELKAKWKDRETWANLEAVEDLQDTLYDWLEGMVAREPTRMAVR